MREHRTTLVLVVLAVAVVLGCFLVAGNVGYGGTDGAATDAITATDPGYQPWFEHLWAPESKEIESALFALQAALGGAVIGFVFGTLRERRRRRAPRTGGDRGHEEVHG
ncbi:energy-coupling factor ABC transporter substrate-binding protein [Phycicoccus sp. CSK15P-2]|uniref:energy-coupling factor ABC transporter substrate-binding protein n=1 Tax=Phycicoccus sp. CSK15P-2 TaxID=2807627 RepID=UPI0019524E45|nr:energy-coupling factor ABC transporter substrate-binding protein [Phycicoccus sp. CSK15P-2]MBM6404211.1 energy-coupling factor ABC transporter substrate-binding protein [Phycicoccus sp. CSK15P-2]